MDPLTPTTSTLSSDIAHIATTAATLARALQERVKIPVIVENGGAPDQGIEEKERRRQTVRWVLDAPRRLRESLAGGEMEAARRDWEEVRELLDKWKGTKGVDEVRQACEKALDQEPNP